MSFMFRLRSQLSACDHAFIALSEAWTSQRAVLRRSTREGILKRRSCSESDRFRRIGLYDIAVDTAGIVGIDATDPAVDADFTSEEAIVRCRPARWMSQM